MSLNYSILKLFKIFYVTYPYHNSINLKNVNVQIIYLKNNFFSDSDCSANNKLKSVHHTKAIDYLYTL